MTTSPESDPTQAAKQEGDPRQEAFNAIAELKQIDQALYHLNDRYGICLAVSYRGEGPMLTKHLLERAVHHFRDFEFLRVLEDTRELLINTTGGRGEASGRPAGGEASPQEGVNQSFPRHLDLPDELRDRVRGVVGKALADLSDWQENVRQCLSSERYDSDLGIEARRIVFTTLDALELLFPTSSSP